MDAERRRRGRGAVPGSLAGGAGRRGVGTRRAAHRGIPDLDDRLRRAEVAYEALLVEAKASGMPPSELARRALEVGLVVHDGAAWLFVLPAETWYRYDGLRLQPRRGSITASDELHSQE